MNNSYKTAIKRNSLSRPLKYLIKENKIKKNHKILDFGCGRGGDVEYLSSNGYKALGWDPHWNKSNTLDKPYDIILCTYVLNVVNSTTRKKIINQLKDLTKSSGSVYITVRRDVKKHTISKKGTHQYNVKLPFKVIKENASYCIYSI